MTTRLVRSAALAAALAAAGCSSGSTTSTAAGPSNPADGRAPVSSADPGGGIFRAPLTVLLHCTDYDAGCAAIRWTRDGSDPTLASTTFAGAIVVAGTTTLKFRAEDRAGNLEPVRTEHYLVDWTAPVSTAAPPGGAFNAAQTVTLGCEDAGAGCGELRYTLDGTAPTLLSPVYAGPLVVAESATLRFFALDLAGNEEAPRSATFVVDTAAPLTSATPAPSFRTGPFEVALACDDGAGVGCDRTYYTVDGTDPTTASSLYAAPIPAAGALTLRWRSTDLVGNLEPVRSGTWGVDTQRPVTVISPPEGVYNHPIEVTFACSDDLSGCDRTGWRLNWGPIEYAATIALSTDATITYASQDRAGNLEVPRTVTYEFLFGAPEVQQTWPAAGATHVPATTAVEVAFDRAIDPAGGGTVTVSTGAATASGSLSIGGPNVRFTPDATLDPGTTYTVTISGFTDVAGNVQAAPYQLTFTTGYPAVPISGGGSADLVSHAVAYDDAGDGVAVAWVKTGSGCAFLLSRWTAGGSAWSAPERVAPVTTRYYCDPTWKAWAVGGAGGVLAMWEYRDATGWPRVGWRILSGGAWVGAADAAGDADGGMPLAVAGGAFAVAYRSDRLLHARIWDGTAWSADDLTINTYSSQRYPFAPAVAGLPAGGFLFAWRSAAAGDVGTVETRAWEPGTGWHPAQVLDTGAGDPRVAADGQRTVVAYSTAAGLETRLGDGVSFDPATVWPFGANGGHDVAAPLAAGSGDGLAVAFANEAVLWQDGQVVSTLSTDSAGLPGVAAVSQRAGGFAFGHRGPEDLGVLAWSGTGWEPLAAISAGPSVWRDLALARSGAGVTATYSRQTASGARVEAVTFDPQPGVATVVVPARESSASGVRLARNASGDLLAVWRQPHLGRQALFAAVRQGAAWGGATLLATAQYEPASDEAAAAAAVAARGDEFAVAYRTAEGEIASRTLSGGSWSAPQTLSGGRAACHAPSLAAGVAGWGAAFTCHDAGVQRVFAALRPGSAAGFDAAVGVEDPGNASADPVIASNGTTFRVAWRRTAPEARAVWSEATDGGGGFAWSPADLVSGFMPVIAGPVAVVTLGAQYVVVVATTQDGIWAAASGGSAEQVTLVPAGSALALAADGASVWLAIQTSWQVDVWSWGGAQWLWRGNVYLDYGDPPQGLRLAAGGGGFAVLWSTQGNSGTRLMLALEGSEARTVTEAGAALSVRPEDFDVILAGTEPVAAWTQADPADPTLDRIWTRRDP